MTAVSLSPANNNEIVGEKRKRESPSSWIRVVSPKTTPKEVSDLPEELLLGILIYLDTAGIKIASLVCRRWYSVSKDSILYQKILLEAFPEFDNFNPHNPELWRDAFEFMHGCYTHCKQLSQEETRLEAIEKQIGTLEKIEAVLRKRSILALGISIIPFVPVIYCYGSKLATFLYDCHKATQGIEGYSPPSILEIASGGIVEPYAHPSMMEIASWGLDAANS